MKNGLIFLMLILVGTGLIISLSADEGQVPQKVLERFLKTEISGGRLTFEGWDDASRFFLRPAPRPQYLSIVVVSDKYTLDQVSADKTVAKFAVSFYRTYGRIDSALRFFPQPDRLPTGPLVLAGGTAAYDVVLSDKHWELSDHGKAVKEVVGPFEWKIKNFQAVPTVDPPSAIRYVSEMRNGSADDSVKKNAAKTIAFLEALK